MRQQLEWSGSPGTGFDAQDRSTRKGVASIAEWSRAGMAFAVAPSNPLVRIDSQLFRVLLLRHLRLPLPPTSRTCRCGRLLDSFGHHRASCAQAGVLGRRGFAERGSTCVP